MLNNKAAAANREHIRTEFTVRVKEFPCGGAELCSVFCNVLDNAIEACQLLPENADRWLRLTASVWNGLFLLECRNTSANSPRMERGCVVSTKQEHGWGLEILKIIAKKYQGAIDASFDKGIFLLRLTLQYPEEGEDS